MAVATKEKATGGGTALAIVRKFFPVVTAIADATKSVGIEVTKADASSRAVQSHGACAMAVACKRKFNLDGVIISRSVAYLIKGDRARRFKLPESVSREIVSFDRGATFAVGKYMLASMPPGSRLGVRAKRVDMRQGRDYANGKKRFRHVTTNVRSVLGGVQPEGE